MTSATLSADAMQTEDATSRQ
ncbi:Pao retrotransposon peptidase superfamily, partial [Trichinella spiralis]